MAKQENGQLTLQKWLRTWSTVPLRGEGWTWVVWCKEGREDISQEPVTAGKAVTDMRAKLLQHQAMQ